MNGDGFPDLLVGAPSFRSKSGEHGRACLYLGTGRGFSSEPSWTAQGRHRAAVGAVVAGAGDLNKDGYADFVLGTPNFPDSDRRKHILGRLDIFYGGTNGFNPGDVFPTDGINATPLAPPTIAATARTNAVAVALTVPVAGRRGFSGLAVGLMVAVTSLLALAALLWTRKRQRDATGAERARIAKDLHDDLGARLTQISLLGEMVGRQGASARDGSDDSVKSLSASARELAGPSRGGHVERGAGIARRTARRVSGSSVRGRHGFAPTLGRRSRFRFGLAAAGFHFARRLGSDNDL